MGLFSSKRKTEVAVITERIFSDEVLPESAKVGAVEGIFKGYPMVEAIQAAVLNGPYRRFEKMYRYAERGEYVYGLPNATVQDSTSGSEHVVAAIEAEIDDEDIESLMHDNDKVASSAVGTLVQTKDMTETNHFFEGQALLKKVCRARIQI